MVRRGAWCLMLAASVVLSGCAGGAAGGSSGPARSANTITTEELDAESLASLSVYDAIQRLRPNWLRSRGTTSIASSGNQFPAVLLNGTVDQNINVLQSLRVTDVELLRYIDSRDATTRYGTGLVNGLIEVTLRRGQ